MNHLQFVVILFQSDMQSNAQWQSIAVTWATMVNVIITACYAIFAYLLWKTTNDSVKLTRQMFEASYSPYLGVQLVEISSIMDDTVMFQLVLKNYGNSPARNLTTTLEFIADGKIVQSEKIGPASLPPQGEAYIKIHSSAKGYGRLTTDRQVGFSFSYESIANKKYHRREKYGHIYVDGPLVALACDEDTIGI